MIEKAAAGSVLLLALACAACSTSESTQRDDATEQTAQPSESAKELDKINPPALAKLSEPTPVAGVSGTTVELEDACVGGDAKACFNVAVRHQKAERAEQAVRYYRRACDAEPGRPCLRLGQMYEQGHGSADERKLVAFVYSRGCRNGDDRACVRAARAMLSPDAFAPSKPMALGFYMSACRSDDAEGCEGLAWMYEKGVWVDPVPAVAAKLYARACTLGSKSSCTRAGGADDEVDFSSETWLEQACEDGFGLGCFALGQRIEDSGSDSDTALRASEYYVQACNHHIAMACAIVSLPVGSETELDQKIAQILPAPRYEMRKKACEAGGPLGCIYAARSPEATNPGRLMAKSCTIGFLPACRELRQAMFAQVGEGGDIDASVIERLVELARLECEMGGSAGCQFMGESILMSDRSKTGYNRAIPHFRRACDQGAVGACQTLAVVYREGRAGPKEPKRAKLSAERSRQMRKRACNDGDTDACATVEAASAQARYRQTALHRLELRDACRDNDEEQACSTWVDQLLTIYGSK